MLVHFADRVTRRGDFSPKFFGYIPDNLQKFWAIFRQITEMLHISDFYVKIMSLAFLATFVNTFW